MTREEALPKERALDEIYEAVRKLPVIMTIYAGRHVIPDAVPVAEVLQILTRYIR